MKTTNQARSVAMLGVVVAAALSGVCAQAGVIDVNRSMAAVVNQDANAKAGVLSAIGIKDAANWQLQSFRVSKMRNTGVKLELPKAKYVWVASKEVVNCDATGTVQTIVLSKEVTNSSTISKSDTFDASVSATVGVNAGIVAASGTATAGMSMTDTNSSSKIESVSITESTTIQFAEVGGRTTVLWALKMESNEIAWTATFTPADDDWVQVSAERRNVKDRMCIWENANFTGKSKCYGMGIQGDIVTLDGKTSAISVPDGMVLRIWKNRGRTGDMHDVVGRVVLDRNWNDRVGSIAAIPATHSGSVQFSVIKDKIPEGKRTFTAKGTMQISKTAPGSTKIVNYPMDPVDWTETCSARPSGHEMAMSTAAPAQVTRASATKGVAPTAAASTRPAAAAAKGVKVRDQSEDRFKAKLRNAKPPAS